MAAIKSGVALVEGKPELANLQTTTKNYETEAQQSKEQATKENGCSKK